MLKQVLGRVNIMVSAIYHHIIIININKVNILLIIIKIIILLKKIQIIKTQEQIKKITVLL